MELVSQVRLQHKSGFTLVELLVVISIIALLLAILMPSLQKVREQAQSVVCKTRLKDIGTTINMYMESNNGKLPACTEWDSKSNKYLEGYRWMDRLASYYSRSTVGSQNANGITSTATYSLFRCPTQDKWTRLAMQTAQSGQPAQSGQSTGASGDTGIYGYNENFTNILAENYGSAPGSNPSAQKFNWSKYSDIVQPSSLPLFADLNGDDPIGNTVHAGWLMLSNGPHPLAFTKYKWKWTGDNSGGRGGQVIQNFNGPAPNHDGKTNYLMADFHAETMGIWPWRDLLGTDFHPKRNLAINPR